MKRIFTFFSLSFLLVSNLFAQSFFEKDTKYVLWRTQGTESSGYHAFEEVFLDSVISGTEYYHSLFWIGNNAFKKYYKVQNNKVYLISYIFKYRKNEYHLVYDFNLLKGDSLNIDTVFSNQVFKYKVDSVSKISIKYKEKKVQFMSVKSTQKGFAYSFGKFTFIEGIGSLEAGLSFFEQLPYTDWQEWQCLRICMKDSAYLPILNSNRLQFFSTPCMDSAYQHMVEIKNPYQSEPFIFPNPINDLLNINNFKGNIALFDFKGSIVLEETIASQTQLDVRFLPKGIYYLKLYNNKGSDVRKILKL